MSADAAPSATPLLTPRRWAVWGVVVLGAAAAVSLSAHTLVVSPPPSHRLYGVLVILLLTWAAHHPVPLRGGDGALFSSVFVVCAAVMYGAAVAALVAATVEAFEAARIHQHPLRVAFNTGVFALMGGAAGLAASIYSGGGASLVAAILLAAAVVYVVNIGLVGLMIVHARFHDFVAVTWSIARVGALPFGLACSIVPLFVVTWRTYPYVALVAVVPLAVVVLHLRSLEEARQATALASTDPLTSLGNRRLLSERLARELDRTDRSGGPLSVCILDVDKLKAINDGRGHEAGDQALVAVADALRQGGEAFRLGGDELVLLLPGHDAEQAGAVAAAVRERVSELDLTVSTGTATYDGDGLGRDELLRVADQQLYAARATRR